MRITGTLINYYIHCKRQCWLAANYLNLEDESELVKIGKALHEEKLDDSKNTEIAIDHIKIDKISQKYLTEIKKSDADPIAAKWQVLYYLSVLDKVGLKRKGRIEFLEKNKSNSRTEYVELTEENEKELNSIISGITELIDQDKPPATAAMQQPKCKKCAYRGYCYI